MTDEERDIEELREGYHKNRDDINELKIVLMGPAPNRNNGIRGELTHTKQKLGELSEKLDDMWNNKRKTECFGVQACIKLEGRVKDLEDGKTGTTQMNVAKTNLNGVYFLGLMTFLGQILIILKDLIPQGGK